MNKRKNRRIERTLLAQQARKEHEASLKEKEFKKQQAEKPWLLSEKAKLDYKIFTKDRFTKNIDKPYLDTINIIACTSLSPSHHNTDNQLTAIESWHKAGMKIHSFNCPEEVIALKKIYPEYINFVYCDKTTKHIFGKPCIIINEMIDHFKGAEKNDILMLINSDIILNPSLNLFKKVKIISEVGIIISSRNDYTKEVDDGKKYSFGFDVFFIHNKFADIFPPAMYSMGQTWWDYWLPYTALKNRIPVFRIEEAFAFHKEHAKQYNDKDWHTMTRYFKFENNIDENNHQLLNDTVWKDIINNSIPL